MKRFYLWLILGLMSSTSMVAQNYKITVIGKVCNQLGHGIPDVVVNDGENFVKTDMKGKYRIVADTTKSKFIAISTPAEYILPHKDGIAFGFYAPINKLKGKSVRTHNFILN
nr:TonB-dependent receptor [Prevotella sp.]